MIKLHFCDCGLYSQTLKTEAHKNKLKSNLYNVLSNHRTICSAITPKVIPFRWYLAKWSPVLVCGCKISPHNPTFLFEQKECFATAWLVNLNLSVGVGGWCISRTVTWDPHFSETDSESRPEINECIRLRFPFVPYIYQSRCQCVRVVYKGGMVLGLYHNRRKNSGKWTKSSLQYSDLLYKIKSFSMFW